MNTFNCVLVLQNKNEWLQHVDDVIKSSHLKTSEELLTDILTFNFKFDTILQ